MKNALLILAAAAAGYVLVSLYRHGAMSRPATETDAGSPFVPVIEEVLHQHQGEDTPMAHAFEAALEEERRHEPSAHGNGARA